MEPILKRKVLAMALCGAALIVFLTVALRSCRGGDYEAHDRSLDSPDALAALAIVTEMADAPSRAADCMSSDARRGAVAAVEEAAKAMSRLGEVTPVDAIWYGDYMRLTVSCPREGADPLELRFFLVREDGGLRITGMQK